MTRWCLGARGGASYPFNGHWLTVGSDIFWCQATSFEVTENSVFWRSYRYSLLMTFTTVFCHKLTSYYGLLAPTSDLLLSNYPIAFLGTYILLTAFSSFAIVDMKEWRAVTVGGNDKRSDVFTPCNDVFRIWVIRRWQQMNQTSTQQLETVSPSEQKTGLNLNLSHNFKVVAAL